MVPLMLRRPQARAGPCMPRTTQSLPTRPTSRPDDRPGAHWPHAARARSREPVWSGGARLCGPACAGRAVPTAEPGADAGPAAPQAPLL